MRKPLKESVRNDWKSTIKLISAQRLNADSPVREKKKKRFPFFALVLKLSLSRWNSFMDISLWTRSLLSINSWGYSLSDSFLISQLPQGSLCQDVDLYYLLSLLVASGKNCLFPKSEFGFQDTNPDWRFTRKRLIHTVPQVATRWHYPTRPSFTYLPRGLGWWEVGMVGRRILERGSRIKHNKKLSYISFVRLYQKKKNEQA